jgi:catechol 2,3-dioxygenase-like lactoylglutathione lyase family enzyme
LTWARRIVRISRVVADLDRAARFYRDALGFSVVARGPTRRAALAAAGVSRARAEQVVLRFGEQRIALVCFAAPGRRYPADSRSDDLWFQHLALAVNDIEAAYRRLCAHTGWRPISQDGPQLLPPSSGGVRAFKFRDPDGHPLELIWFPPGHRRAHRSQGIDHTALAVAATARSLKFYRALGLRVRERSLNHGPAQARLDGLPDARVQVTALRPSLVQRPGIELLGYRPPGRRAPASRPNDVVTDWITLDVAPTLRAVRDPDGHLLLLSAGRHPLR